MKLLLSFLVILFLNSCSSSSSLKPEVAEKAPPSKPKQKAKDSGKKRYKSQVTFEDEKGNKINPNVDKGEKKITYDLKDKKLRQTGGWLDIGAGERPGKYLQRKSVNELIQLKAKSSPYQLTLIIEELLVRKESSIPALATFLDDDRLAVFEKGREYWWYQKKNQPAEPVNLAVYAAYTIQRKTSVKPSGVIIGLTKDRMFYAVNDGFAVVKEDLQKVWKEWWRQAKNDY